MSIHALKQTGWSQVMNEHTSALPFSGLGHDLAPVMARASVLSAHRAATRRGVPQVRRQRGHVKAGYALQVALGRETRGR
jgi:hypothetical protein